MQLILPQQQQQQIRTIGAGPRDGFDVPVKFTPPYMEERCANLIQWTRAQYTVDNNVGSSNNDNDDDNTNTEIPQQYGVYPETPDVVTGTTTTMKRRRVAFAISWGVQCVGTDHSLVLQFLDSRVCWVTATLPSRKRIVCDC